MFKVIIFLLIVCVAIAYWEWALLGLILFVAFNVWVKFSAQRVSEKAAGQRVNIDEAEVVRKSIKQLPLSEKIIASPLVIQEFKDVMTSVSQNRSWSETLRGLFYHQSFFVHEFSITASERDAVLRRLRRYEKSNGEFPQFANSLNSTLFDAHQLAPKQNRVFVWLKTLPIASRIHFMNALKRYWGRKASVIDLHSSADSTLHEFGFNLNKSCRLLQKSGFLIPPDSFADFGRRISKEDLVNLLSKANVQFPKSATKARLCALADSVDELKPHLEKLTREYRAVKVAPQYREEVEELLDFHEKMKPLCFAIEFLTFSFKPVCP